MRAVVEGERHPTWAGEPARETQASSCAEIDRCKDVPYHSRDHPRGALVAARRRAIAEARRRIRHTERFDMPPIEAARAGIEL